MNTEETLFDMDETPIDSLIVLSNKLEAKEHGLCLDADELKALMTEIQQLQSYCGQLEAEQFEQEKEIERYQNWVNDLQSGMYINCVYCGHQYGPREDTPVSMSQVLKEHIEQCPEHPLSTAKQRIIDLENTVCFLRDELMNQLKHSF